MADEQVTSGSVGPPQRQPRRSRGATPAAERADEQQTVPNLDERERNISPRRKAMGPVDPAQDGPVALADDADASPEVPPTDPQ
jgi:hypothetical protein